MNRCLSHLMALCAIGATLGGCAVGPDFKTPAPPTATRYTETPLSPTTVSAAASNGAAQTFELGGQIPAEWWTLYRSEPLDRMIRTALAQSPSLGAAQATLRQARETLKAERGALLFPSVDAQVQGVRERISGIAVGQPLRGGIDATVVNATLNASYNLDVFGGAKRQVEGFAAQVDYSRFELEVAYLTLSSSVVSTAIKEASIRAQLQATEDVVQAEEKQLSLVERQYSLGAIPKTTVLAQRTQLATTRSTVPALEKSLAQTRDQLAVLVGKPPSEAAIPDFTLDSMKLPTELPISVPADLVRQRPDVRASEAQLHYASAQVGVATAALYPQVNITAQYGRESLGASGLFQSQNAIWSLASGITQPLFRAGQLTAQRRAAIAAYEAAFAQYQQSVLLAFQSVADALKALESDAQGLAIAADAESLAHQNLDLAQTQYRLGATSYLTLLDAQRQFDQTHINLVSAQATRFADTAALFQALGGGWWNRTEPMAEVSEPEPNH